MGSDDSGKAGRITGAGDAAESDIATESDNAGGNGPIRDMGGHRMDFPSGLNIRRRKSTGH